MTDLKEEWKVVKELEHSIYQISNLGNVRRFDKRISKFIKVNVLESGWKGQKVPQMFFGTNDGSGTISHFLKKTVASLFLPNPKKLSFTKHIDRDYKNCRVDNLEWIYDGRKDIQKGDWTDAALAADEKFKK